MADQRFVVHGPGKQIGISTGDSFLWLDDLFLVVQKLSQEAVFRLRNSLSTFTVLLMSYSSTLLLQLLHTWKSAFAFPEYIVTFIGPFATDDIFEKEIFLQKYEMNLEDSHQVCE